MEGTFQTKKFCIFPGADSVSVIPIESYLPVSARVQLDGDDICVQGSVPVSESTDVNIRTAILWVEEELSEAC